MASITRNFRLCLAVWVSGAMGALASVDGGDTAHWAYIAPERPALPEVRLKDWPRNAIDFFVLDRLEKERLEPSPEADRATLIRRLSLDLIGLPPTMEEVEAFLRDREPGAYERVVDRLLASPRHGERWARPWLDMARYADTQGYEKDNRRSIWPYRDWVIGALNADMPFDRFTIEQLAGDLLPGATRDQKVATGFHRNTQTNTEGGTDDEEFRHAAVVDRVDTTMTVWMGTTFACAQCHDHKYDPISMKEYYRFYGFFNQTADEDQPDDRPVLELPTPGQERRMAELNSRLADLEGEYHAETPVLEASRENWEENVRNALSAWRVAAPVDWKSEGGAVLQRQEDGSILAGGKNPANDVYMVELETGLREVTGLRLEVMPDESLPRKSLGRHENGSFVLTGFEVEAVPGNGGGAPVPLDIAKAEADYTQEGHDVRSLIDGRESPGWAVQAFEEKQRVRRSAYFTLAGAAALEEGARLRVRLLHRSQWPEANVGRFRLSVTSLETPVREPDVPDKIRGLLVMAPDERDEKQARELDKYWRSVAPDFLSLREELERVRKEREDLDGRIARTLVMQRSEKERETRMLMRGNFLDKGEPVSPGVPAVFHSLPEKRNPDRQDLARWLVDARNPLTARVTINRMWERYFGIGLVETGEDFGTQGERPSHPRLLDWLADEFMRQGWRMKTMHKLIVMSATYRQSSAPPPDLVERDPYNRLLARGPRVRLEAEMLRDQALSVSGLLSDKLGGPSVMPPQPEGLWQVVYSGDDWKVSPGEDRYRRGLYTFWRRTNPHPMLTTFDAPSREFCVVQRNRSNTPLQALVLLNDPVFVEAAQALARRMVAEAGSDPAARATYGFRLCLAREPSGDEVERLVELQRQGMEHYAGRVEDAARMAASELGELPEGMEAGELAAWTVVANVLLNLDELITKP